MDNGDGRQSDGNVLLFFAADRFDVLGACELKSG